ncbi:aconitate hydratase AcnA [Bosea sp. BH3]|uniref:aconitate hydratase AcnA n=1 Tax=Bosea sp. BH3 TaxID=2871701 RepID=UPI0021CB2D39|nr:aconitate hydratase AcnA [Bosea sp. BH3]MCU4181560.1 aconitate hydratase AcnA [Bosea sp. BH3]
MKLRDLLASDAMAGRHVSLAAVGARAGIDITTLPYACRVFVENLARGHLCDHNISADDVYAMLRWRDSRGAGVSLTVGRVILPDSSGLPVLLDLASLRDAVAEAGFDPASVEPRIPVDVIVDHSLQVDVSAAPDAMARNMAREFERNGERYSFLKWAQQAFRSVRVFPPGTGIIHQVNLENIASVVTRVETQHGTLSCPDFVIGGDSHTPMINGIGVLGWGVGGIEAQAAMLGQPYVFPVPEFVGVRLVGSLPPGATTTDLVLTVTEKLRREGVVSTVVEYFGPGAAALPVPSRATLANMAPEYGATAGFFPIDEETFRYLVRTRTPEHAAFVRAYAQANALFREPCSPEPAYARVIEIDLARVTRSVAGPRRPQDRLDIKAVAQDFDDRLPKAPADGGFAAEPVALPVETASGAATLRHGALAIAAITACTNTSNPAVMVAAGLLARNAVAAGLRVPGWVKTSLAPGSRVVTRYLEELGLLASLEQLGFGVVGYGCTTCGGKSGPLLPVMAEAIDKGGLVAAAALSGNRNFEGRIHRQVRANYIMSPPLVVAFALAGRIDIDLEREPLNGPDAAKPIYLADLWPGEEEIAPLVAKAGDPQLFREVYGETPSGLLWDELEAPTGLRFRWDPKSSYLVEPPFLALAQELAQSGLPDRLGPARVLGAYGDSLTTDHISPSGEIPLDSPAGRYLVSLGIEQRAFNTYVGRRCNHEVMARATFANLRIRNLMVPGSEGGWTRLLPEGGVVSVHAAAEAYRERGVPLIVLGAKDYGMGSSRDWAAKGSALLGVRAVIAESYERIHRSNLIGMGVVPLRFAEGEGWRQLGLDGTESFDIDGLAAAVDGHAPATVVATSADGRCTHFHVTADVSTQSERACLRHGGVMAEVLAHFTRRNTPEKVTEPL